MQVFHFLTPLKKHAQTVFVLFGLLNLVSPLFAQTTDSTKRVVNLSGAISANNNGFSFVPTFSLGKPAVQTGFNISGKGRLSFHPQFWYSMLDYKPWSFIFIWRYQLIKKEKFQLVLGTHAPAINFKSGTVVEDGVEKAVIKARRFYPAAELLPIYQIKKDISLSLYYLFGKGIEKEVTNANHFLSFRADFNRIPLSKRFFLRFNPQVYYLRIADNDGVYTAANLALAREGWPFSISAMINKALQSNIAAKDFDWNVSFNYAFGRSFVEK